VAVQQWLVKNRGWTLIALVRDSTQSNANVQEARRQAQKKGDYQKNKNDPGIPISDSLVDYGDDAKKKNEACRKAITAIPFAVGNGQGGKHCWFLSNGNVYEVHWDRPSDDPKLYEVSPITGKKGNEIWDWGAIVVPPSSGTK
jgi:hypothetical protein